MRIVPICYVVDVGGFELIIFIFGHLSGLCQQRRQRLYLSQQMIGEASSYKPTIIH